MKQKSQEQKKSIPQRILPYVDGKADSFFEYFIIFVIILNSVVLGIATSPDISAQFRAVLDIIDKTCLAVFVVELVLKFIAYNKHFFSASKWNTFDLFIVLVSIFGTVPYFSIFRGIKIFRAFKLVKTLKTLRVVKTLKIINSLKHLQVILKAIVFAIPSIIWTFLLLLIAFYFYAIIGVNLFGAEFSEHFGSLGRSFYTLFQLMLFDDWGNITRPILKEFSASWIYFVSFGIISAYTILQVVTGIVVESIQNVTTDKNHKNEETSEPGKTVVTAHEIENLSKQIKLLQKQICELNIKMCNNGGASHA
ncbi:MAG: ion transporter [Spirochaetales bacterium]|nr:ion transporter [Spirochaetales bacterium]